MSIKQVNEGIVLKCTLGTCTSNLVIPDFHNSTLDGRKTANIADHVGGKNIMPFGNCTRTSPPPGCTPTVPMKWINGQKTVKIDGELALLNTSIVACVHGGIISIEG